MDLGANWEKKQPKKEAVVKEGLGKGEILVRQIW